MPPVGMASINGLVNRIPAGVYPAVVVVSGGNRRTSTTRAPRNSTLIRRCIDRDGTISRWVNRRDYVDEVVELAPCPNSAIKAAAQHDHQPAQLSSSCRLCCIHFGGNSAAIQKFPANSGGVTTLVTERRPGNHQKQDGQIPYRQSQLAGVR